MSEESPMPLSTGRLKAFVDGVLAIAITILVLDLDIPDIDFSAGEGPHFLMELGRQLHPYVGSFALLAAYWVQHTVILHYAPYSNRSFLWLNILFLLPITLMPFLTTLRVDYPRDVMPAALYGGGQILCGLLLLAIWRQVAKPPASRPSHRKVDESWRLPAEEAETAARAAK